MVKGLVSIIMGSDSDLEVMKESARILEDFAVLYEVKILSAHRTPDDLAEYLSSVEEKLELVIAGAGVAAHLAGFIAAKTTCPVIGVPLVNGSLSGLDSLYATVQMPSGFPVATMAIGVSGAKNAALFAISILALKDLDLKKKLGQFRDEVKEISLNKNKKLQQMGWRNY